MPLGKRSFTQRTKTHKGEKNQWKQNVVVRLPDSPVLSGLPDGYSRFPSLSLSGGKLYWGL